MIKRSIPPSLIAIFALCIILSLCITMSSCSERQDAASLNEDVPVQLKQGTPRELVFEEVLFHGNLQLMTAFADINRDGKPDLILGSNGHAFSDSKSEISKSISFGPYRHFVSHLSNISRGDVIRFDDPVWPFNPDPLSTEGQLPSG